ncbi:MAG TPA: DUF4294 domain-containing protein [Flavobacteriales bacterium]|nr:DUF4294 domain-containing protein [Flavobacteriales bacterium]HNU56383.1 DUF4294 domain-containing protein [Flavobacteriales bacterium]
MVKKALAYCGLTAVLFASTARVDAQAYVVHAVVESGDTIPLIYLGEAEVQGRWKPRDRREAERYDKLMRNVIKVYPYARITAQLLSEYEGELKTIEAKHDQDLYVKVAEAELRAEFEAEVKDLTVSQGKVLVKLIDRETGQTSYELVKQLRGGFVAFMWQGLARLFDQDLKSQYDPEGTDATMELIVQRIERGELPVADRSARTAKAQAKLERRKARLYRRYGVAPDQTTPN